MLLLVFLIAVAIQVWSWSWATYPFLALLMLAGLSIKGNYMQMALFWQGLTWAGYLALDSHGPRYQAESEDPLGAEEIHLAHRALTWQIIADLILLCTAVWLTTLAKLTNVQGTNALTSIPLPIISLAESKACFMLGATFPILKIGSFGLTHGKLLFPWTDGNTYARLFWVSGILVATYQVVALGHICVPALQSLEATIIVVGSALAAIYLLTRAGYTLPSLWRPTLRGLLPPVGGAIVRWDHRVSLRALDISMSTLQLLGNACIGFEDRWLHAGEDLLRAIQTIARLGNRSQNHTEHRTGGHS